MENQRLIYHINNQMGIKQLSQFKWGGVVATGKFEGINDYNTGILYISIYKNFNSAMHSGVSIITIDDGVWQTSGEITNENVEIIAQSFISKFGQVLPSEQELNEFLMPYGLWGVNTG